ncbi:hypothetical protein JCM11491_000174 [Sporobolomyces phaffii]
MDTIGASSNSREDSSGATGLCVVCGKACRQGCSTCSRAGLDWMYFCSVDHQKLIWPVHKRVCGANPFRWPTLTDEEAAEILTLRDEDCQLDYTVSRPWAEVLHKLVIEDCGQGGNADIAALADAKVLFQRIVVADSTVYTAPSLLTPPPSSPISTRPSGQTPRHATDGGYNNGSNYGTRIGIGVGIAVAVAIIILLVGFTMRRRRARAFKTAYPLQSYPQGNGQGLPYAQQPHTGGAWNGYGQGGYGQGQPQQPTGDFPAPPPQYSGYRADSNSRYENNAAQTTQYAPPQSPPPAASQSTSQPYYAPPPGPPPTSGGK